jgi:hypothetical protein
MTPLEQRFRLEVEFHRLMREASEPRGVGPAHTSYALEHGAPPGSTASYSKIAA